MRSRLVLLVTVVAVAVVPPAAGPATTTGLRGTVLQVRPICMEKSCLQPARGVVLVFRRGGQVVARTTSQAEGAYRVLLRPGVYTVSVASRPRARVTPTNVRVVPGVVRRVDFELDSGLQ